MSPINMFYCTNIEHPTREMNGMRILVYGLNNNNNKKYIRYVYVRKWILQTVPNVNSDA